VEKIICNKWLNTSQKWPVLMWLMHNDEKHVYTKLQLDPNRRIKLHDRTIDRGQKKSVTDKKNVSCRWLDIWELWAVRTGTNGRKDIVVTTIHLFAGPLSGFFFQVSDYNILCLSDLTCATWPAHVIIVDLITIIVVSADFKQRNCSSYNFFPSCCYRWCKYSTHSDWNGNL
jgi:hypothetical protein